MTKQYLSLNPEYLQAQPITQNILQTIRRIAEYKGKQDLYKEQSPQILESLRQAAIIQSTESSNRLEGITAPMDRMKELVAGKTTPRNRSEQEIAGYRDVLNTIHANYTDIPFTTSVVLQFHRDLYQFLPSEGGKWKPVDNEITESRPDGSKVVRFHPVPAHRTPEAMETLHRNFDSLWRAGEIEPLLLIPAYVLDFLCIHPFLDGNGRMARLLTLLLLYKADYELGRYISLEKMVEQTKDGYYDCLYASSQGWHEGRHHILPWWEYFLGVMLLGSYKEFERRVGLFTGGRGTKTSMVVDAIGHFRNDFTIRDIQESCPHVGIDLIRKILRERKQAGKLECLGRGPNARWRNR
ncbi:MAG: Fic family protein [Desulfatiglandaceae bacterium]